MQDIEIMLEPDQYVGSKGGWDALLQSGHRERRDIAEWQLDAKSWLETGFVRHVNLVMLGQRSPFSIGGACGPQCSHGKP